MPEEIPFRTLSDYVAAVHGLSQRWGTSPGNLWYRGVDDDRLCLVPSTVWRDIALPVEQSIVAEFLVYYRCYYDRAPLNGLDIYVLMRHYGLPTRLLDWSMSALVSLFFALERPPGEGARPVVWALDHVELNRIATGESMSVVPHASPERFTQAWLPRLLREREGDDDAEIPPGVFAFKHPMSNPRLHAQKGCFTFHGTTKKTLEEIFAAAGSPRLARLVLEDPDQREIVLRELYALGYKEDDIYQDLPALSRRILREHGFEP